MNFSSFVEILSQYVSRHPVGAICLGLWAGSVVLGRFWNPKTAAARIQSDAKKLYSEPHEFQAANVAEFRWIDREWYDSAERSLAAMGFRKLGDYEDVTLSRVYPKMRTFIRIMGSADGTTQAGIYHVRMRGWMWLLSLLRVIPSDMRTVDLDTEMEDGTFASSANTLGRDLSSDVAGISRVNVTPETGIAELLAKHREHVAALEGASGHPLPAARTAKDWLAMQHRIQKLKNRAKAEAGFVDIGQFERCATGVGSSPQTHQTRQHLEQLQSRETTI